MEFPVARDVGMVAVPEIDGVVHFILGYCPVNIRAVHLRGSAVAEAFPSGDRNVLVVGGVSAGFAISHHAADLRTRDVARVGRSR